MKVSVSITTYNHEAYIAQAIESVLMQRTTFDYDIIIGEDDSDDDTRAIVEKYKERYPDKIRLFLNDRKNVIYINGRPTGRWNFTNNLKHTRGEYTALLEGDDYWTNRYKLQKQADFLDNHPQYALCCHNVMVIYDESPDKSHPFYVQYPNRPVMQRRPKPISTLEDLVKGNFIQTPSVMFRARLFDEFPHWYYELDRGDWPLHILNAQHGRIGYMDDIMAIYRVHGGGVYSSKSCVEQLKGAIHAAEVINRHLNYRYDRTVSKANASRLAKITDLLETNGDRVQSRYYALKYLRRYGPANRRTITMLTKIMKGYFPWMYRIQRRIDRLWHNTQSNCLDGGAQTDRSC